jgi:hypothetical protein
VDRHPDRSLTLTDSPLIATPQAYPLICRTDDNNPYLVVGWTSSGTAVGVRQTTSLAQRKITYRAEELTGELTFLMGWMSVSVDGEISASVEGDVTVQGNRSDGSIGIVDIDS